MKRLFLLAWLLPCVAFGASVPFTAFNPNQFEAQPTGGPGPYVAVKNGVALTNVYMPEETAFTFAYFDATNGLHSSGILTNAVGGAFNPTDTFVPYRSNSTTWADSPVAIPSNTQVLLTNGASLSFGNLTASHAMITNNGTILSVRKSNDSDWADLYTGDLKTTYRTIWTTPTVSFGGSGNVNVQITPVSTKRAVNGITNSVTLISTPTIPDGEAGQVFFIVGAGNVTNTVTLQSESALPGSNLTLGAATRTLQLGQTIGLQFDGTDGTWHEMFYSGSTGTGDVTGPASATAGHVAIFADGTGKVIADSGLATVTNLVTVHQTLTYAATTDVDFDLSGLRTVSLTGNITFTTSNKAAGKTVTVRLLADGSSRTLTFPAWVFVGAPAPGSIAANKTAILTATCFGAADTDIVAAYSEQP